jgi:glycosyltransferase involved in cell wall biosynthesis
VLPCYNPQSGWEKNVVSAVVSISKKLNVQVELIIVNDGSVREWTEESVNYIRRSREGFVPVIYAENKGKGHALRKGVAVASHNRIIYTDIDFPYTEDSMVAIFSALRENHDVVLGHRGTNYYVNTPWFRKVVSKFLRWTLKTFLRLPTDDSQCGLKGFNKKGAAVFLDTRINRFLFDMEFIKLASKRKLDIVKVDVELKPNIVFSRVHFGILFREAFNFLRVLFRK